MGFNVSASKTGNQLENCENLRNTARDILTKGGVSQGLSQDFLTKSLVESDKRTNELYFNSQLSILKASTQISLNQSMNETMKYLKTHAAAKFKKEPVLGELWNTFSSNKDYSEENPYKGELYDLVIDYSENNIFVA